MGGTQALAPCVPSVSIEQFGVLLNHLGGCHVVIGFALQGSLVEQYCGGVVKHRDIAVNPRDERGKATHQNHPGQVN